MGIMERGMKQGLKHAESIQQIDTVDFGQWYIYIIIIISWHKIYQNISKSTLYDTAFWPLSQPCKNKGGPDPFNDEIVQYQYNVLQPTRSLTSWQAAEDNHRAKPQHLGGFLGPLVETKDAKFISLVVPSSIPKNTCEIVWFGFNMLQ